MRTPAVAAATTTTPNRLLLALAAAWMIASIALGGIVSGGSPTEPAPAQAVTDPIDG